MIHVRRADERGHANHGWLDSHHTFSFAGYYDPAQMGFGPLRVLNDDRVTPGRGFDWHPHRDMEIVSYPVSGAMRHADSTGEGSVIRSGEVQLMGAGTGILHTEYNASDSEPLHFYQIWIHPRRRGTRPRYAQSAFPRDEGPVCLLVSEDGRDGSLAIDQDLSLYRALLPVGGGAGEVDSTRLVPGDGAAFEGTESVALRAADDAELLFFDLPPKEA